MKDEEAWVAGQPFRIVHQTYDAYLNVTPSPVPLHINDTYQSRLKLAFVLVLALATVVLRSREV